MSAEVFSWKAKRKITWLLIKVLGNLVLQNEEQALIIYEGKGTPDQPAH